MLTFLLKFRRTTEIKTYKSSIKNFLFFLFTYILHYNNRWFIQQILCKHLAWAMHCVRCWGDDSFVGGGWWCINQKIRENYKIIKLEKKYKIKAITSTRYNERNTMKCKYNERKVHVIMGLYNRQLNLVRVEKSSMWKWCWSCCMRNK